MNQEENKVVVVDGATPTPKENSITNITGKDDDVILLAAQAQEKVNALKKIMTACLSITSTQDWVLIGGKPYLQESGCTKVANLLGISFEIAPGFPTCVEDKLGYRTYTYRVRAFGKNSYVEGEGQRSASDTFFTGTGDKKKAPEQINDRDVRIAALTNAKANAIKSIVPGLKNIETKDLEEAGIDISRLQGYSFKEGKQGGRTTQEKEEDFVCAKCGAKVSQKVASYSQAKFNGMILCVECQGKARVNGQKVEPYNPNEGDE